MRRRASPTTGAAQSRSRSRRVRKGGDGTGPVAEVPGRMVRFFADLGPGLITGAADDDPSGISTYSVTGASFGYTPLWTALFSFPLMAAVQLMCARLGMVTGRGLAGVVRRRYPPWVLWASCAILVAANVVNIGADLAGMAEATEMVTGIGSRLCIPVYAALVVSLLFWSSYRRIARTFKWLTLVLFAYVGTAFLVHPDWPAILRATLVPHVEWSTRYLATFVAILGTTISPYLFFWQAGQEVEEERARGRTRIVQREGATGAELRRSFFDVTTGMFFSNLIMYFIILSTAATLHAHGQTAITTAQQAAEALRPLAGAGASWLFALGLIGTGMLGVPVLAGSSAYAIAEAAKWRGSLDDKPPRARRFHTVVAVSMGIGLLFDFAGFDAVTMLFWSAVLNGVLAPPLIVMIVLLTSDPTVMGGRTTPPLLRWLGWAAATVMGAAAIAMFATLGILIDERRRPRACLSHDHRASCPPHVVPGPRHRALATLLRGRSRAGGEAPSRGARGHVPGGLVPGGRVRGAPDPAPRDHGRRPAAAGPESHGPARRLRHRGLRRDAGVPAAAWARGLRDQHRGRADVGTRSRRPHHRAHRRSSLTGGTRV